MNRVSIRNANNPMPTGHGEVGTKLLTSFEDGHTCFAINANHHRNQPKPSHCAMCQYVECLLLLLMPLVELLVHGFDTLLGKDKWEVEL